MMQEQWFLAYSNDTSKAPEFIGPFKTEQAANEYRELHIDGYVSIERLQPPFHSGDCTEDCVANLRTHK